MAGLVNVMLRCTQHLDHAYAILRFAQDDGVRSDDSVLSLTMIELSLKIIKSPHVDRMPAYLTYCSLTMKRGLSGGAVFNSVASSKVNNRKRKQASSYILFNSTLQGARGRLWFNF